MSLLPFPYPNRSRARSCALVACFAPLVTSYASAQNAAPRSPALFSPIVVTATRSPQEAIDTLADVTVIERDEIERAGPEGLGGLLHRQPGVEITRNGGPGGVTGVFLRGTNRGQTVVLVDGVRVGSASTGAATLEAIPLEMIDHVEILRGPASGLYGADAIGGVIQVFTRDPGGRLAGSARAGYGTDATRDASASLSASAGPVRFALQGHHRSSAGFNAIVDPADFSFNPDRDGYRSDSAAARLALPWAPDQELTASFLRNRLNAQFDGGPGHDDRTITTVETWQLGTTNRLGQGWMSRLTVAESVDDSVSSTGFGDFPFRTRQRQYAWLHDLTLPAGALTVGAERREERIGSDAGFAVTARDTDALLGLYQWQLDAHALQLNVRHDRVGELGGRTTGGVRYAWRPSANAQYTAGFATAFKAPSFNDLYYPGFSNPNLAPESSRNVELGATWRGAGPASIAWQATAVAYRNVVRDLIVFVCDAQSACAPQNVARATLEGLTLGLEARRGSTTLHASLDVQDPRDADSGRLLPRRARQHGVLRVGQEFGPVRMGAELVASSHRFDDVDNMQRLAGYGILNLTAEWALAHGWSVAVRGDNVLGRDYELAAHYGTGGVRVFAALRWQG